MISLVLMKTPVIDSTRFLNTIFEFQLQATYSGEAIPIFRKVSWLFEILVYGIKKWQSLTMSTVQIIFLRTNTLCLTSKRELYREGWVFYKMVRGHKNLLMIESSPYRSPDGLLHPQDVRVVWIIFWKFLLTKGTHQSDQSLTVKEKQLHHLRIYKKKWSRDNQWTRGKKFLWMEICF